MGLLHTNFCPHGNKMNYWFKPWFEKGGTYWRLENLIQCRENNQTTKSLTSYSFIRWKNLVTNEIFIVPTSNSYNYSRLILEKEKTW